MLHSHIYTYFNDLKEDPFNKFINKLNPRYILRSLYSWLFAVLVVLKYRLLFVATSSHRRRSHECCRDEWVSEWVMGTIEFRCWLNFDPMFFGATYCLYRNILAVRHSHSIPSRVLPYCDFRLKATNAFSSLFLVSLLPPTW